MNHCATSQKEVLEASLALTRETGLKTVNIRNVAQRCGISVGCVYHYYPSKAELIAATVEKIWEEIFHLSQPCQPAKGFLPCVRRVYDSIRYGSKVYPGFLIAHAAVFSGEEKQTGRAVMERFFGHMRAGLIQALEEDAQVNPALFSLSFSREALAGFVLENLIALETRGAENCDYLTELLARLLFPVVPRE